MQLIDIEPEDILKTKKVTHNHNWYVRINNNLYVSEDYLWTLLMNNKFQYITSLKAFKSKLKFIEISTEYWSNDGLSATEEELLESTNFYKQIIEEVSMLQEAQVIK